ncbi:serine O-acetyltransferase EpsC [Sphingomonas jatrophae]|uniref:Serine acetyltransferase n=1 Tax=Sphingomonas jatrophae TaxID=1166337 RepID=A0A1I6JKF5_9SPHN|nr:serine O-acetyltransferase EpsC [Sphingomonas jatrophae]SFR79466.1 serine O-acetyltransferase [Sphingomonas jatrophae]
MFARLVAYLDSIKARDPAPRSRWEILLYPGLLAVGMHRLAHWLFEAELWFCARFINHLARLLTGIDIHPGAKIGRNLFIDHGFVVIGETAEIGDNVTIYQGATLGGTNPTNGMGGKRHPTLEDGVILSLGAAILGPVTVGAGARIGANAVVTKDVAPGAVMIGIPAKPMPVAAEDKQRFTPYGTPCCDNADPAVARLEAMRCEVERLRGQLSQLIEERAAEVRERDAG